MKKGIVYLIGAGPGDYKLLTLKAIECLAGADLIVYDRLINPAVLRYAKPEAERIYVGKQPDCHPLPQAQINRLLIEQASAGRAVARLKGGDPFLFGRGGEEAEALAAHGIDFIVVPGVTSALAVPAYAGIPLTHRDYSSAVHIVTGHARAGKGTGTEPEPVKPGDAEAEESHYESIDFEMLAKTTGTLVFLMGVRNLPCICRDLIAFGKSPATPVAVIEKGTTAEQRCVTGRLENIADAVTAAGIQSPAVTVIGPVVTLKDKLDRAARGPLWGKRILVTRSRTQAGKLTARIEALGGEAVELPVIKICEPQDYTFFDACLQRLNQYNWLVFTSVNGVNAFFDRLSHKGQDIRELYGIKLCAVGAATAMELHKRGLNTDFVPTAYTAAGLLTGLLPLLRPEDRLLLARGDLAVNRARPAGEVAHAGLLHTEAAEREPTNRDAQEQELFTGDLAEGLRSKGFGFDDIIVYRTMQETHNTAEARALLESGKIDCITFTSSSTAGNFIATLGSAYLQARLGKNSQTRIACIGPVTAATVRAFGLPVAIEAATHTIEGLVRELVACL